jgi:hypothetical protein
LADATFLSAIEHRNAAAACCLSDHALLLFPLENGERITSDQGGEFPSDEAAPREAEAIARDLSKNQIKQTTLKVVVTSHDDEQIGRGPLLNMIQ